jgi:uncharacterized membrane protein
MPYMTTDVRQIMNLTGLALDLVGVLIVAVGSLLSIARVLLRLKVDVRQSYRLLREDMGRAILLGLEFLIAGDIIRSVVVDPTLMNILTLGLIVLIRTFLSMTLQLEVEGSWPWQRRSGMTDSHRAGESRTGAT